MKIPELAVQPTMPAVAYRAARTFGERDFVVTPDQRLSFAQAERASRRIAKQLLAAGVGKGTRVGVQLENSAEWALTWLAITRIGAVMATLSTAYKPAELAKIALHADLHMLITQDRLFDQDHLAFVEKAFPSLKQAGTGPLLLPEAPYLRSIRVCTGRQAAWSSAIDLDPDSKATLDTASISDAFLEAIEAQVTPADLMVIIYTSGTTGEPKGVVHTHGSALRHSSQLADFMGMTADWRYYCGSPFFWVAGIGMSLGTALFKGAAILTVAKHEHDAALGLMRREKATHLVVWPTIRQKLDFHIATQGIDVSDIPIFAAVKAGRVDFGLPPGHGSLGMTETWGPHSGPGPDLGKSIGPELQGSFGVPADCVEMRVISLDTGEPQPREKEGELCVRGYSLMQGFYKRERHDTFDSDGWLHTGDRVFFRGDYLFFTGRHSEMIKSAGANVAPGEVEAALYAAPGVGFAVAMALPDAERGEIVGAVLVPRPGAKLDVAAIRDKAGELLSGYKQPRKYLLLGEDELPYLASGKPDKKKLREWLIAGERPPA